MSSEKIKTRIDAHVIPTYARFPIALTHGEGCHVFDADGKRYLDLGAGIATACLGHGRDGSPWAETSQRNTIGDATQLH